MTHLSSAERQPVNTVNSAVTPLSDLFANYYQISDGSPKNTT
ncbi:hypothetical protein AYX14_07179 [Cryptococcus neoformans]|nr:hypothetical protein AYX14_07179 [Cryptococcus neoformans var. grubii]